MGLTPSAYLSFLCTSEHPLLVCCFLCFFLGTRDGEWFQEQFGASGTPHTEVDMLGTELKQLASEMSCRVASMRKAFSLTPLSFLLQDLKPRQI